MVDLDFKHALNVPREKVFEFHKNPANLGVLLQGWSGFRLLHHQGSITPNCETWVEVMVANCIPVVMGFRHTVYEPPRRFGEIMIHGPFQVFEHTHHFDETLGGTLVHDRVRLVLRWPFGGQVATRTWVVPTLRRFFTFRHAALDRSLRNSV